MVVVSRGAQERGGTATPACNGSAWYNVNAAENSWEPSKPSRLQPGAMQRLGKTNSVHGVVVVGGGDECWSHPGKRLGYLNPNSPRDRPGHQAASVEKSVWLWVHARGTHMRVQASGLECCPALFGDVAAGVALGPAKGPAGSELQELRQGTGARGTQTENVGAWECGAGGIVRVFPQRIDAAH